MKKILVVFGTRPEAIKMMPLIKKLQEYPQYFDVKICVTAQHRQLLDQILDLFEITPDYDLDIMVQDQDLFDITSGILLSLRGVLDKEKPNLVFVHGDTTTAVTTALSAYYKQIPVAHIEAGLRTNNIYSPWPEEINRQIIGRITSYHFSPTLSAKNNLIKENISEDKIIVTGNTVIDSLNWVLDKIGNNKQVNLDVQKVLLSAGYDFRGNINDKKLILITGHRRENFGDGFLNICSAIKKLSEKYPDVDFIYPMHLNPSVRQPIRKILGEGRHNLFLIEPLDYLPFIYLMSHSFIVLTDSGGVQEEAPALGKPVLVIRNTTERPEALNAGTVKLVGTDCDKIVTEVSSLLDNKNHYNEMSAAINPYGDGKASQRIVEYIMKHL